MKRHLLGGWVAAALLLGIAVPYEMQEEYKFDSGTRVTAIATYARFRRFDVSTDEEIRPEEKAEDKSEEKTEEKIKD